MQYAVKVYSAADEQVRSYSIKDPCCSSAVLVSSLSHLCCSSLCNPYVIGSADEQKLMELLKHLPDVNKKLKETLKVDCVSTAPVWTAA